MSSPSSSVRVYRMLAASAILHALLLSLWLVLPLGDPWETVGKLWVAFATLWLFWPIILILHPGRSFQCVLIALTISPLILYPSFRDYPYMAPRAFGLPQGVEYLSIAAIRDYFNGYHAGRAEAENDLRLGRFAHEEAGLPMPKEYYDALKRHAIEPHIYGDLIGEKTIGHVEGYNEVSEPAIKQKFGTDVVAAARDEAIKHWKEAQEKPKP